MKTHNHVCLAARCGRGGLWGPNCHLSSSFCCHRVSSPAKQPHLSRDQCWLSLPLSGGFQSADSPGIIQTAKAHHPAGWLPPLVLQPRSHRLCGPGWLCSWLCVHTWLTPVSVTLCHAFSHHCNHREGLSPLPVRWIEGEENNSSACKCVPFPLFVADKSKDLSGLNRLLLWRCPYFSESVTPPFLRLLNFIQSPYDSCM